MRNVGLGWVVLCSLRVDRDIGLPCAFAELERHMEIEPFKEQLSGPGHYHLNFGGRRVSLQPTEL